MGKYDNNRKLLKKNVLVDISGKIDSTKNISFRLTYLMYFIAIFVAAKTPIGALEVKATHCSCDVTFDLETYNWFYNMIIFLFKGTIRKAVEDEVI